MKANNKQISQKKGMTLLELTVVILVLLTLISVLFIGAKAWKDGADRSNCILNIRNFQVGVRSYANMNGTADGVNIPVDSLTGDGNFISTFPVCPSGGVYDPLPGENVPYVVATGNAFLTCSLAATDQHAPTSTSGW